MSSSQTKKTILPLILLFLIAACVIGGAIYYYKHFLEDDPSAPDHESSSDANTTKKEEASPLEDVTGHVYFEGGSNAEAACGSCSRLNEKDYPEDARTGNSCRVKVDPCKLVTLRVDNAPVCHTVSSLCDSETVPSSKKQCMLREKCGRDFGWFGRWSKTYLKSIELPKGMILQVKNKTCNDNASTSLMGTNGGKMYRRGSYQAQNGFQFGIAPGFKLKCKDQTYHGITSN